MGGVAKNAGVGGKGLCPALTSIASVIVMIIALGIELGMLYDHRIKDFKAAADGTAFLQNGTTCVHHATKADIEANYGAEVYKASSDATKDSCQQLNGDPNDLQMLLTASVHWLYYLKGGCGGNAACALDASTSPTLKQATLAYYAARAGTDADSTLSTEAVYDTHAIQALNLVAQNVPDTGTTCDTLYGTAPLRADCLTAAVAYPSAVAALNNAKTTAGIAAANNAVAVLAGGSVGDGSLGDAELTALATAGNAITDEASAQAYDAANGGGTTVGDAYTNAAALILADDGGDGEDAVDAATALLCAESFAGSNMQPNGKANIECYYKETGDTAAKSAIADARADNADADNDVSKWNLYLQCKFANGLTGVSPVTSPFSLLGITSISRGGTLGIPLPRYENGALKFIEPAIPLAPFLEGVNGTLGSTTRGQILYGYRMGWSMFAVIPTVLLIVYLGVDAVFAAICYLTRALAFRRQKFEQTGKGQYDADILQALVTMQAMRWMRFAVATTGFLIIFILRIVYDWVPWNFGQILPRAGICPSQGNGWETEEGVAVSHLIVILLILAVIVAQPIAVSIGTSLFVQNAEQGSGNTGRAWLVNPVTKRVSLWFLLISIAGFVLIGLESVNAVAYGVAWGNRVLQWTGDVENGLTTTAAVDLIEKSITGAVLSAISLGVLLAAIYTRYLFSSKGWLNKICSLMWIGVVIAGLFPLLLTFGSQFSLDPDQQAVADDCANFGSDDTFEKFLCENRQFVYTIAIVIMAAVVGFMWICWLLQSFLNVCTTYDASTKLNIGSDAPVLASAPKQSLAPIASDKIPLLSLRVKH